MQVTRASTAALVLYPGRHLSAFVHHCTLVSCVTHANRVFVSAIPAKTAAFATRRSMAGVAHARPATRGLRVRRKSTSASRRHASTAPAVSTMLPRSRAPVPAAMRVLHAPPTPTSVQLFPVPTQAPAPTVCAASRVPAGRVSQAPCVRPMSMSVHHHPVQTVVRAATVSITLHVSAHPTLRVFCASQTLTSVPRHPVRMVQPVPTWPPRPATLATVWRAPQVWTARATSTSVHRPPATMAALAPTESARLCAPAHAVGWGPGAHRR